MQTEEDRPLGIGWRELDIPIIASFRTQLGPDVMRTRRITVSETLNQTQAKGEEAVN